MPKFVVGAALMVQVATELLLSSIVSTVEAGFFPWSDSSTGALSG